ncbi:hypothetical protein ATANTOWER_005238, partial [Ataeniobius toweri]|nr:hypothetical protein [Ataeniobius toweri]
MATEHSVWSSPYLQHQNWSRHKSAKISCSVVEKKGSLNFSELHPKRMEIKVEEREIRISLSAENVKTQEDDGLHQPLLLHQIKTEDDRETEPSTSSSAEQMKIETDGEDCRGADSDSSDTDVSGNDCWQKSAETGTEAEDGAGSLKQTNTPEPHLKDHESRDAATTSYSCSECGKLYCRKWSLMKHLHVHSEVKPFLCKNCGETFSQYMQLKMHVNIHKGEKQFCCEYCGKTFQNISTLKRHAQIHSGQKGFSCDKCGKSFSFKSHLKSHLVIHTDEKPFCCN